MSKRAFFLVIGLLMMTGGCMRLPPTKKPVGAEDAAALQLLDVIRLSQPEPYGLPDHSTYNYIWAQYMLSFLAAERCGYMEREESLARLSGMLKILEKLERHHGFFYDEYDVATGKPKRSQIYFQGWWIYTLAILKNAYPELSATCEKLLAEIDYENSGMFNPKTRQLAADYSPAKDAISYWIDLYVGSSGEMRTPYVAYTYLTGDISPWTKKEIPKTVDLEGAHPLAVWHNFFFCTMLVHSVFPDVGYFERSWEELLTGLDRYRVSNGMAFYPTRAEPLEIGAGDDLKDWPNTEHRIAKSWLAWFGSADAPVMEKAWIPGFGVSLYYDNMNFYWSYGSNTLPGEAELGTDAESKHRNASVVLPFLVILPPPESHAPNPARLTSIQLSVSISDESARPEKPLDILLNGVPAASIDPDEVAAEPRLIRRTIENGQLVNLDNRIELVNADPTPGRTYRLHRRDHSLWRAFTRFTMIDGNEQREPIAAPYAEIIIDGQYGGRENPFALLTRCAVVHGYYVWHELLNDPQFLENTVVWIGDYYNRAKIGRVVHNTSDRTVEAIYERPDKWTNDAGIRVLDVTGGHTNETPFEANAGELSWTAESRHTYRLRYEP